MCSASFYKLTNSTSCRVWLGNPWKSEKHYKIFNFTVFVLKSFLQTFSYQEYCFVISASYRTCNIQLNNIKGTCM